ncbi:unnamed protein product [Vitrella brassicaformis CCMP3155]|uniref:FAD dependent oxidoreductase domain-containing protein n=1 Tax=Vitrella brassicaformis (strain CCMP3155) TaxID=1169540 RepID=A0A0G4GCM8_VITBC|nr:unnamed protein product [Vitrella brassicaformis CCMP3155]|eukprot:CEM26891.1 unnamed protein product [Vitrella brassicaformis CCMP3155]
MSDESQQAKVVICGGGIIGCSVAYHLAREHAVKSIIVERTKPACAASGKAGGFLAKHWNDHSPVGPLARVSYALHAQLAKQLKEEERADVMYRQVHTIGVMASDTDSGRNTGTRGTGGGGQLPEWLDKNVWANGKLGDESTTAQVHPRLLTEALLAGATRRGAQLRIGRVEAIEMADDRSVTGVKVDGTVIPCEKVVIAMGPWTKEAAKWLALPQIGGQRYHSITMRPKAAISNHCLFIQYHNRNRMGGWRGSEDPEIYPRPDNEVYMCGFPDMVPVPDDPGAVVPEEEKGQRLKQMADTMSGALQGTSVEGVSCCFLPLSPDNTPLIGEVPGCNGVYVATGHSCWVRNHAHSDTQTCVCGAGDSECPSHWERFG